MRMLVPECGVADPSLDDVYAWPDGRCVRVNFVASIDGAATVEGRSGGLSSELDKAVFFHLRDSCDVVLVGAGTVRNERYRQARVPVAVVTNRLSLHADDRVFTPREGCVPPIVFVPAATDPERRASIGGLAEVVDAGEEQVDLAVVVAELERRGMLRILCEGGPTLFGDLLAARLVDELCLTMAPTLTAGTAPRIAHTSHGEALTEARLLTAIEADSQLLLRYAVG